MRYKNIMHVNEFVTLIFPLDESLELREIL